MGNWANGFTIGLCLGMGVFAAAISLQRRRRLQTLEALLQSGAYRVLNAEGGSATASDFLGALERAAGNEPSQEPASRRAVWIWLALLVGFAGGAIALMLAR